MFCCIVIIFALVVSRVYSSSVCDSAGRSACVCRYDAKTKQDYVGEDVDCSYTGIGVFERNSTLPSIVNSLDVSWNNLTSIQPSSLLISKTLKRLKMSNNDINDISADAFDLPELIMLDLSHNKLKYIDKNVFRNMKKLKYLNLANNNFITFAKSTFHYLSSLEELILDNNNIGPTLLENKLFEWNGFGVTERVKSLSISGINLEYIPINFFVDAYNLRKLIMSNNKLTYIFDLPFTLQYLDVSNNPIEVIAMEDFTDLPALEVLMLNNLAIRQVPEYVFEPLHSIRKLYMERNKNLTQFSTSAFGKTVLDDPDDFTLEELSLRGSRLETLDDQLLLPFGQLSKLDLQGNPWKCDCKLSWLKKMQISLKDYDQLRCASPAYLYNARIMELKMKNFTCPANKHYTGIAIAVIAFCLVLATIAMWLFIFLPKYQLRSHMLRNIHSPATVYNILSTSSSYP